MAQYLEWDYDWRDTRTGKTGTYRAGSTGLQTEEDVKRFVEGSIRNVEYLGCRLVGEGASKQGDIVKPIAADHVVHDRAELKKDVRAFLKS